jgi:hypothetical protein
VRSNTLKIKYLSIAVVILAAAFAASAQKTDLPAGFTAAQFAKLKKDKGKLVVPLPTWLPAGFKFDSADIDVKDSTEIWERKFIVSYLKKFPNGNTQRFMIEAGFDGLGGGIYEPTAVVNSPVGSIELLYEPKNPDDETQKLERYVMTEWFEVAGTAFHYDGLPVTELDETIDMISVADTKKILGSLKKF